MVLNQNQPSKTFMKKHYTRACNFYYGKYANLLIKKKLALPLCGNKYIAFDKVEIFTRNKNKVLSKTIELKKLNTLGSFLKKKSQKRHRKDSFKKKKFFKKCQFFRTFNYGSLEFNS